MKQSHTSSEHVGKIIAGGLDTAALAKMPHAPEWPESWEARKRSNEELLETLPVEVREECRLTGPDEAMPEFQLPWGRVRIEYTPEDEDVDGITKETLNLVFRLDAIGVGSEQRDRASEAFCDTICPKLELALPGGFEFLIHGVCPEPGIATIVFCPGIGSRAIDLIALAAFVGKIFIDGTVDSVVAEVVRQLEASVVLPE